MDADVNDGVERIPGMPLADALQVLVDLRKDDQIVVTSMGTAREWPRKCQHPLDLHYVPSTMSGGFRWRLVWPLLSRLAKFSFARATVRC